MSQIGTRDDFFSRPLRHVRADIWICLFLTLLTLAVYRQIGHHRFINFDDGGYVYENPRVIKGLSADNIVWAFTTGHESNWHPITWISHMIDGTLYGLDAGHHHRTNLFIHICNTLLLFLLLRKATGNGWCSGMVAALFALHPLQVESVAWISERKNLLCGFFWMLTLLGYLWYTAKPSLPRYLAVASPFALGLMAKPMIVTLPFVLLLLDYWPLSRFGKIRKPDDTSARLLVAEKAPLFLLSVLISIVTFLVQQKGGAVTSFAAYPLWERSANAILSCVVYIKNMLWPFRLAVFYPLPEAISVWRVIPAASALAAIFYWVLKNADKRPYACFGWLWFVGTLVPVIGLVQTGSQALADRYAYLPIIGLFIGIVWTAAEFIHRRKIRKIGTVAAAASLAVIGVTASVQVGYWKDSYTLFSHAVAATTGNALVHNNLGLALAARKKPEEAVAHYLKSLQMDPGYAPAHINLGNTLAKTGSFRQAIHHYRIALRLKPLDSRAYKNYGLTMVRMGRPEKAAELFRKALALDPDNPDTHSDMGIALALQGRMDEAAAHFREALRIAPGHKKAANALKLALNAKRN